MTPSTTSSPSWGRAETSDEPAGLGGAENGAPGASGALPGSGTSDAAPGRTEAGHGSGGEQTRAAAVAALTARLDWEFQNPALLVQALSHRSWCAEAGGIPSNERLEFLGDAILGAIVCDLLFRKFPSRSLTASALLRSHDREGVV